MIYEIGSELEVRLRERSCPIDLVMGPERTGTTAPVKERIVLERSDADSFGSVRGQHKNPKQRMTRRISAKITIYAKAEAANAAYWEHERRAEHILDLVLVGMEKVALKRRTFWTPGRGQFIVLPDAEKSRAYPGAVYELAFTIDRGVADLGWDYGKRPEATIGKIVMSGTPTLTFAEVGASGDTVTRSAGSWITDGFAVGMVVKIAGSTKNNVTGAIAALTATVLTFGDTDLQNEGPIAGCTVRAGGIASTTKVSLAGGPDDDGDFTTVPAGAETSCG